MKSLLMFLIAIVLLIIGANILVNTDTAHSFTAGTTTIALGLLTFLIGTIINHQEHTRRK